MEDILGRSVLYIALQNGQQRLAECMLAAGATISRYVYPYIRYYISPQCFIITFYYSLTYHFWELLMNFDWLVY